MGSLTVHIPSDLNQLKEILQHFTSKSKFLAGGTDLVVALNRGIVEPDQLVLLSQLKELNFINEKKDYVEIGAVTTFSDIAKNMIIRKYFNSLTEAAENLGSTQVRNMATIGGNIANASPAGDSLVVLLMLDAKVDVMNRYGQIKTYSVDDLLKGAGSTNLDCTEVITSIRIPIPKDSFRNTFVKLGNRGKVTIALINIALGIDFDEKEKKISDARIVLGSVDKKVFWVPEIEWLLKNKFLDIELIEEVVRKLEDLIEEKHRSSSLTWEYKKKAVKGVVYDLMYRLLPEIFY